IEVPLLYGVIAATLLLTGPGLYSVDAALGLGALSTPVLQWGALAIGLVGGIGNLFARRPITV
ncbi:MAG: DoxX family protein, partial [Gemmatimonadaceae bacterium]